MAPDADTCTCRSQKDLNSAFNNFVAADYIQHNPDLGDGRQTAIDGLKSLWADPKTSFAIHRIFFGEDGFVVQSEASFAGGPRTVVYDIFALQGTCITEHCECSLGLSRNSSKTYLAIGDNMQAIKSNTVSQHPYF